MTLYVILVIFISVCDLRGLGNLQVVVFLNYMKDFPFFTFVSVWHLDNPTVRTASRPSGFSAVKSCNTTTTADSSGHGNNSSSSVVTRKLSTTGPRQINSFTPTPTPVTAPLTSTASMTADGTPTAVISSTVTTANTAINCPVSGASSADSHSRSFHQNASSNSIPNRSRGRTQQPYLLNTPTSHTSYGNNAIDYTSPHSPVMFSSSSLNGPNENSKTLLPMDSVNGGLVRDRPHVVWESEAERETIQSILSAVPAPQVRFH